MCAWRGPPVVTGGTVRLTLNAKLLKSVSKLARTVAGKCNAADRATLLPGPCGAARNVGYCIETHVECRV